jgi:hypothetical protein
MNNKAHYTFKWAIDEAFKIADNYGNKVDYLPEELFVLRGMSSYRIRIFLNQFCKFLSNKTFDVRYLEIGTYRGSTILSSAYENSGRYVGVDNFVKFAPKRSRIALYKNLLKWYHKAQTFFIEADCFKLNLSLLLKNNVFFYDGDHSPESHYKAIMRYHKVLDDHFVLIVDDWSREEIRDATYKALKDLKFKVEYFQERFNPEDGNNLKGEWWNGFFVAHVSKPTDAQE